MPYIQLSKTEGNLIICGLHRHILYMGASEEILEMLLFSIALTDFSLQRLNAADFFSFSSGLD